MSRGRNGINRQYASYFEINPLSFLNIVFEEGNEPLFPRDEPNVAMQVDPVQDDLIQIAAVQVAPVQVAPVQVPPVLVPPVQVPPGQVPPVQVAPVQVAPVQVDPVEVAPMQVAPPQSENIDENAAPGPMASSKRTHRLEPSTSADNSFTEEPNPKRPKMC